MEQQRTQNQSTERNTKSRSEEKSYRDVATKAVYQEAEVKVKAGPAVSMTVVGERVEFTQHFHF